MGAPAPPAQSSAPASPVWGWVAATARGTEQEPHQGTREEETRKLAASPHFLCVFWGGGVLANILSQASPGSAAKPSVKRALKGSSILL